MNRRFLEVTKSKVFKEQVKIVTNKSYLKHRDVGLIVNTKPKDTVEFKILDIRDTGLPIRHIEGNLIIDTLICLDFTADLFNSIGNLTINNLIVEIDGSNYSKKDYSKYHIDALGQFFNKKKTDVGNVNIHNIDAIIVGKLLQGMMLSEGINNYHNFNIGTGRADIDMDYPYAFNANQLSDSYVNVGNNGIIIKNRKNGNNLTKDVIIKKQGYDQLVVTDSDYVYYV